MTKGPLWLGEWQVVVEGDRTMNKKDNDPALMHFLLYVLKCMYALLKSRYCFNCVIFLDSTSILYFFFTPSLDTI